MKRKPQSEPIIKCRLRGGGITNGFLMPNMQPIPMEHQQPTPMIYCFPQPQTQYPNIPCQYPPVVMYNFPGPCNFPPMFVTLPQAAIPTPLLGIPTIPQLIPQCAMFPQPVQQVPAVQPTVPQFRSRSSSHVKDTTRSPPLHQSHTKEDKFFETKHTPVLPSFETKSKPFRRFTLPAIKFGDSQRECNLRAQRSLPDVFDRMETSDNTSLQMDIAQDDLSQIPSECMRTSFIRNFADESSHEDHVNKTGLTSQQQLAYDILSNFVQRKKNIVLHLLAAKAIKEKLHDQEQVENRDELLRSYNQHKTGVLEHMRKCAQEQDQIRNIVANIKDKNFLRSQLSPQEDVAIEVQMTSQGGESVGSSYSSSPATSVTRQSVVFPSVNELISESDPSRGHLNRSKHTSEGSSGRCNHATSGYDNSWSSNYPSDYSSHGYTSTSVDNTTLSVELARRKDDEEKTQVLGMLRSFFQHRRDKLDNLLKLKQMNLTV